MTTPQSSIAGSIQWIVDLLHGALGVSIAVLAVAIVGFRMLLGNLPVGSAMKALLGMFVLFLAPAIAEGIIHSLRGAGQGNFLGPSAVPTPHVPKETPAFDPYAGAVAPGN